MEPALLIVLGIALIVIVALFAKRVGVAAPIILLLAGFALSYTPGIDLIEVPHEVILFGILPPILYTAAQTVPLNDFRRNIGTISSLSVLLVIVSAFATGFLLFMLLPDLNLAAAIALGAVISPPDAVAAISIGKRLGLPPRLVTVLEGEGLVNDATALVMLRSAIVVAAGGVSGVWAGIAQFGYAIVAAIFIGLALGALSIYIRSRMTDPVLDTAVSLLVPFLAFIPAERIGASGVIAAVAAGLYTGHSAPRIIDAQARINERLNWRTVQFILEHGVFLIMGLELHFLIHEIDPRLLTLGQSIGLGLLATAVLFVIRFLWVNPMVYFLQRRAARAERVTMRLKMGLDYQRDNPLPRQPSERRVRMMRRTYERMRADLEHLRNDGLDWRGGLVLSWSGMRGVITLAAAQSMPDETPYRNQLVLIAFTVAVTTLVVQGGTLPLLIRALKIPGTDAQQDRRQLATLLDAISTQALRVLDDPAALLNTDSVIDPDVINRVRQDSLTRSEAAWERANSAAQAPGAGGPHQEYRLLRQAVIREEREALLRARRAGRYPSRVLAEAQALLDLEEARLHRRPNLGA